MVLIVFWKNIFASSVILVVYVDDILIINSDIVKIAHVKDFLQKHLTIHNLGVQVFYRHQVYLLVRQLVLNQ